MESFCLRTLNPQFNILPTDETVSQSEFILGFSSVNSSDKIRFILGMYRLDASVGGKERVIAPSKFSGPKLDDVIFPLSNCSQQYV